MFSMETSWFCSGILLKYIGLATHNAHMWLLKDHLIPFQLIWFFYVFKPGCHNCRGHTKMGFIVLCTFHFGVFPSLLTHANVTDAAVAQWDLPWDHPAWMCSRWGTPGLAPTSSDWQLQTTMASPPPDRSLLLCSEVSLFSIVDKHMYPLVIRWEIMKKLLPIAFYCINVNIL